MEMVYNPVFIAMVLVGAILVYDLFIKPRTVAKLSIEQLELIDFACDKAVGYAEQTYKNDPLVDRGVLALDYAFEIIRKTGIVPEKYVVIIEGIIKDNVLNLPKTHDADGNLVI